MGELVLRQRRCPLHGCLSGQRSAVADADSYLRDGGKRSAFDQMSDLIRGVGILEDPENGGGTKQLSNLYQYHFNDGFGNYRCYEDPNMTPEKEGAIGNRTQMTEAPQRLSGQRRWT